MKLFITFTRSKLIALLSSVLLVIALASQVSEAKNIPKNADTNAKRTDFATSLGYDIYEECIQSKKTVIPQEFSDTYEKYNEIQKTAGYDLKKYAGSTVTVYKYKLKDKENAHLNLIVYNGRVIGGDVSENSINGSMKSLKSGGGTYE